MYGSIPWRGLGGALEDVANDTTGIYTQDPQLAQLHQLALLILAFRREIGDQLNAASNADATTFDPALLTTLSQQLAYYVGQFRAQRAAIDQSTVSQYALSRADQAMLDLGNWAQQVLAVLPSAAAAIPNAVLDAIGKVATRAGSTIATSLAWPVILISGLLIGGLAFVRSAERTHTGRALARRL